MRSIVPAIAVIACLGCPRNQTGVERPMSDRIAMPNLQTGNTVMFLGDSITWQNLYTTFMESYFTTRYPEKRLRFVNRGVQGDTAAGAVERFQSDVAPGAPDIIIVMLGMNDGGHKGYNRGLLRGYLSNLEKLLDLIAKTSSSVILVTPTCMDPVDYNAERYNRMLAAMTEGVISLGRKRRVPVIDLFTPFSRALEHSQEHPSRLMLDKIHPGPGGHLVIADTLLKHLDPKPKPTKETTITATGAHARLVHPGTNIYLPDEAEAALDQVPFKNRLDRTRLSAPGLNVAHAIYVGDTKLGTFSPKELANGVDLDRLDQAPWSNSAKDLFDTIQKRWRLTYYLWDPSDLGADAWKQIAPTLPPPATRAHAKRTLAETKMQLENRPPPKPTTYELKLVAQ